MHEWPSAGCDQSRASYGDEFRAFVQWCIKNLRPANPAPPRAPEDDPF